MSQHVLSNNKRKNKIRIGNITFDVILIALLLLFCVIILYPFLNVVAISLSSSGAITRGDVGLLPVEPTFKGYEIVFGQETIYTSYAWTLWYAVLNTVLSVSLTACLGYSLSVPGFVLNKPLSVMLLVTMFFSGGTVPAYLNIKNLGLMDTTWALVLPGAVPIFNVVLMMNFFRSIPHEIEEAAFIDGAGHFKTLVKIYLPLSLPSLATVSLFVIVNHWNSWFDGIIYMNHTYNYPLQSYLRTIIINPDLQSMTSSEELVMSEISERTFKAAQIFLGALPILCVYPFLQKYFMSGLTMGSVKG